MLVREYDHLVLFIMLATLYEEGRIGDTVPNTTASAAPLPSPKAAHIPLRRSVITKPIAENGKSLVSDAHRGSAAHTNSSSHAANGIKPPVPSTAATRISESDALFALRLASKFGPAKAAAPAARAGVC